MNGRAWTKDDDAIIIATIQRSAVELGRTRDAVNNRRSRLVDAGALAKWDRRPRPDCATWTAAEDAIVIATVGLPVRSVAERIPGHTPNAIGLRRRDLRKRGLIESEKNCNDWRVRETEYAVEQRSRTDRSALP